jgi:asparagine synthase (glutamine-hydrolysing)
MNVAPYVALIAQPGTSDLQMSGLTERLAAMGLSLLLEAPGLRFLGHPCAPHFLPRARGTIFWGSLFDRRSSTFALRCDDAELLAPLARFVTQYWGGYLALRADAGGVELFRDPSGMIPVYVASLGPLHIVTSVPALLFELGLMVPALDWSIVTQALAFRDLRPAKTALRGISELLPGMRLWIEGERLESTALWSPWRFTSPQQELTSFDDAARKVRETILQVSKSWAGSIRRPIVELSGGLDSSIVAAGLAAGGADPLCVTFIPSVGDSDERLYARAVTDHLGIRLEEVEPWLADVDVTRSDAAWLPRPCARNFAQALDRPLQQVARDRGADMFFSGGGGDNIFCHLQSTLPVIDLMKRQGISSAAARAVMNVAEVADVTFWEALANTARRRFEAPRTRPRPWVNQFLSKSAIAGLPWPTDNPWLDAVADALPGKRRHVWSLVSVLNHLEGFGRQQVAPICSPLLSQPVVETCLSIPTWLWFEKGRNRSVAREAFQGLLPASVTCRKTKAAFDSLGAQVIRLNASRLRSMLLDGVLVREGIADRHSIDRALQSDIADGEVVAELLGIADVEAWAAGWETWSL